MATMRPLHPVRSALGTLLQELDAWRERIPLPELLRAVGALDIAPDDIGPFVAFGDQTYRRNIVHTGPAYQALLLCWRHGQRSPIHDHSGSSCALRVVQGTALETLFARAANRMIYAVSSREMKPGFVCASQDDDIHQVSNLADAGGDLITLHIYSPPLLRMGTYSLFDASVTSFLDPVFESVLGDGGGI